MKLIVKYSTQFKKDFKKLQKQNKDIEKLFEVIEMIASCVPLDSHYKDHHLKGEWANYRECHIEPDYLLIYQIYSNKVLIARTGSHSELFKK